MGTEATKAAVSGDITAQSKQDLHFWVSTFPFFDCILQLVPPRLQLQQSPVQAERAGESTGAVVTAGAVLPVESAAPLWSSKIKIFDADGALANEVGYGFSDEKVVFLELDSLLGSAKLESGLKHAHVVVSVPAGCSASMRLVHKEGACLMGPVQHVSPQRSGFLPVTFSQERSNLLCAVNTGTGEAVAKLRLFCGKRNPETILHIPPRGARVISLELEFQDYTDARAEEIAQGYVRITLKHGDAVGVQVLEQVQTAKDSLFFSAIS